MLEFGVLRLEPGLEPDPEFRAVHELPAGEGSLRVLAVVFDTGEQKHAPERQETVGFHRLGLARLFLCQAEVSGCRNEATG